MKPVPVTTVAHAAPGAWSGHGDLYGVTRAAIAFFLTYQANVVHGGAVGQPPADHFFAVCMARMRQNRAGARRRTLVDGAFGQAALWVREYQGGNDGAGFVNISRRELSSLNMKRIVPAHMAGRLIRLCQQTVGTPATAPRAWADHARVLRLGRRWHRAYVAEAPDRRARFEAFARDVAQELQTLRHETAHVVVETRIPAEANAENEVYGGADSAGASSDTPE